ncbi:hypothetical protein [Flavobacterium sp. KACC 22763]|uniref:hypothetical protein n=1 Tax=Flavobacterium sp. KACC 22763 TaxID=3025668 RepID=UPI002365673D|nr:hypothetical protein [Flavobacterium sp. KACC 22763]WDF65658.1 hypothetical protein PQ463_05695 [Flavobacterium sp. KACC 22763]
MGFFKKIGQSIKKNVSFKNLVKVATTAVGFVPGVGGIAQTVIGKVTDAVEAKKMAKEAEAQGKQAEADYWNAQTKALEQSTANTVGAVAGAGANLFGKSVVEGAYNGLDQGLKTGVANVGVSVVDMTISGWFKKHWKWIAGVGAVVLAFILWKVFGQKKTGTRRARR